MDESDAPRRRISLTLAGWPIIKSTGEKNIGTQEIINIHFDFVNQHTYMHK